MKITTRMTDQISLFYFSLLMHICSAMEIPAFYIFGDSLADVGNNLYVDTPGRPQFPNGIDFGTPFGTPSGRYTNGRTVFDIIGQEVGLQNYTPAYLAPTTTGDMLLKGANYASSTTGILNETGWGNVINLNTQISYFAKTRRDIISNIGDIAAKKLLKGAIYVVATGANDIGSIPGTHQDASIDIIISRFKSHLKRLYRLDARKVVVTNCGAFGCIPFQRDRHPFIDGCVPFLNQLAQSYNEKLKILLEELNTNLPGSKYIYADIYSISVDIVRNYISYGFENADYSCCHVAGFHGGLLACVNISLVCADRTKYVFWDPYHLTETGNLIAAKHMMYGGLNYISPMNIQQLINS